MDNKLKDITKNLMIKAELRDQLKFKLEAFKLEKEKFSDAEFCFKRAKVDLSVITDSLNERAEEINALELQIKEIK